MEQWKAASDLRTDKQWRLLNAAADKKCSDIVVTTLADDAIVGATLALTDGKLWANAVLKHIWHARQTYKTTMVERLEAESRRRRSDARSVDEVL